jgi:hypothetical protein
MRQLSCLLALSVATFLSACNRSRFLDMSTGNYVDLEPDARTGLLVDKETHQPPYIYVDTKTNDTVYGATGEVINNHVVIDNGKYKYDKDEFKLKDGDYKMKIERNEFKEKTATTKTKVERNERKIKTAHKKIKIEHGHRKVKRD